MKQQHFESEDQQEQLVQQMHSCEKQLNDCSLEKFSELRQELKQVKEKLRLINQFNRLK